MNTSSSATDGQAGNAEAAWMVYGAYGYTGRRIVRELIRRGHRPVLAGRDGARLKSLAAECGNLPTRVFAANDPAGARDACQGLQLLINAAGPFAYTGAALARCCIDAGCHYLDVGNEPDSLQAIYAMDKEAAAKGVVLLPGAGFGAALASCLSLRAKHALPQADRLDILLAPSSAGGGLGTRKTFVEGFQKGAAGIRNGVSQPLRLRGNVARRKLPFGSYTLVPVPLGDAEAALHATGIPNITAYIGIAPPPFLAVATLSVATALLRARPIRRRVRSWLDKPSLPASAPASTTDDTAGHDSYVWVSASNGSGGQRTAWLKAGEGYAVTVDAVVSAAERVARGEARGGAHTAASAFGGDFPATLSGVVVRDA